MRGELIRIYIIMVLAIFLLFAALSILYSDWFEQDFWSLYLNKITSQAS